MGLGPGLVESYVFSKKAKGFFRSARIPDNFRVVEAVM